MRKFLPKTGFLFEKLSFSQLKNRNKRVLGGALLSTEHAIRMVKEFQDCVACRGLVFLFPHWILFMLLVDMLEFWCIADIGLKNVIPRSTKLT